MPISPPFLPPRTAAQTEEDWLNASMVEVGNGRFPVSKNAAWHGGVHLEAPRDNSQTPPVRFPVCAITDGTIEFVRAPTAQNANPADPQNYGDPSGTAVWTDNGCVVIKHEIELGANAAGNAVTTTFFSVYMHLSAIDPRITNPVPTPKQKIFRKETIGTAGQIYGEQNRIHFEIICDNASLERLIGRSIDLDNLPSPPTPTAQPVIGNLPFTQNGRTDSVYGSLYFHIPANTPTFTRSEAEYLLTAEDNNANPLTSEPNPPASAGNTGTNDIIAKFEFSGSDVIISSMDTRGTDLGFAPIVESNKVYSMGNDGKDLRHFVELNNSLQSPPGTQVPTKIACFELLRFGRVIGTFPLNPATTPNWRRIPINATGTDNFINLNSPQITVFSDADFGQWDWIFVAEGQTTASDSRSDDPFIRSILDLDGDGNLTQTELDPLNFSQDQLRTFSKIVAHFPTEWNEPDLDARWNWLKNVTPENPTPLTESEYNRFLEHCRAFCFWSATIPGISNSHWHFHPKRIISHLRKCSWLSQNQCVQLIPRDIVRRSGTNNLFEHPVVNNTTRNLIRDNYIALNRSLRLFMVDNVQRMACFFGNSTQETRWFSTLIEVGTGPATQHQNWQGRGFLQLTVPNGNLNGGNNNYYNYFRFLGESPALPPNAAVFARRGEVETIPFDAAFSAGFYWNIPKVNGSSAATRTATRNRTSNQLADGVHPLIRSAVTTNHGVKSLYMTENFRQASASVNRPNAVDNPGRSFNGLNERGCAYVNALVVLGDVIEFPTATAGVTSRTPVGFNARRP